MRRVRFARLFSFPFSCSKSVATVCVAVWKRRRSSGSTYVFHSAQNSVSSPLVGELKRRCSAADAPSGLALVGICRSNSARNGSSSEISIWLLRRQISISARLLKSGQQEVTVQLLHIKFGALPHAAPQNRSPFVMHFQHVPLRFLARIAEDALENHGHVTHQIDRIVMHHHLPGKIELFLRTGFFFNRRLGRRYGSRLLV